MVGKDRLGIWLVGLLLIVPIPREASAQAEKESESEILMSVNGMPITVARFKRSYLQRLMSTGGNDTPQNRQAHLENLVATYLMADEARNRDLDSDPAYQEFENRQFKAALGAKYFNEVIADSLPPLSESEVRAAFRNSKEQVSLRHLFFRDPERARATYQRLLEGEDFVDLANELYATSVYDSAAGSLGFASYWELDDAVAEAAFSTAPGEFTKPIRSRHGWHILRVDDRLVNPILTESEFQTRRSGIEAKARIRRNILLGDELVRSIMDSAAVEVDPAGVEVAVDAISDAVRGRDEETTSPRLLETEITFVRKSLQPDTPLMTYSVNGRRHTFTGADLVAWLPDLEYPELRDKPLAAMGRALRNEVLAQKGLEAGLADEPNVRETVEFVTNTYLARALRETLEPLEPSSIPEEKVQQAYRELGYRELRSAHGDWWQIGFSSLAEAEAARDSILLGSREPASFATYRSFDDADLNDAVLGDYVRRSLRDRPMLVCSTDATCHVLYVDDVRLEYASLEESESEIRQRLSEYLPEVELLLNLRDEASIEADSVVIEQTLDPP